MTTAKTPKARSPYRLPYPPEKDPDDMTSAKHLAETGNMHHLKLHLGRPETTIVKAELFLANDGRGPGANFRVPDLLIAFDADPELYEANNGYIVSEQGKPPDFVLEIASPSTRATDNDAKREFYARHGVLEYWRFDEEESRNSVRLAGDRLVNGVYEPIAIEELPGGVLQGYSPALNLHLRREQGELRWHDPAMGQHIATFEGERARADQERARAEASTARAEDERARAEASTARAEDERAARIEALTSAEAEREARIEEREARAAAEAERNAEREARAAAEAERNAEREARLAAEARVRELEARLAQQNP